MLDTGWPWPLDGVQAWFENLFNSIAGLVRPVVERFTTAIIGWVQGAIAVVNQGIAWLGNKVTEVVVGARGAILSGLNTLWFYVQQTFSIAVTVLGDAIGYALTTLSSAVGTVGAALSQGVARLGSALNDVWLSLSDAVNAGISWLNTYVIAPIGAAVQGLGETLGNMWDRFKKMVSDGLGAVGDAVSNVGNFIATRLDGAIDFIGGKVIEILGGVATAIGEGLRWLINWLVEHLRWFGEMIIGAAQVVAAAVGGAFNSMVSGLVNLFTKGIIPGSPEPEVSQAVSVMVSTTWQRQMDIIKSMYKSPPSPEDPQSVAQTVIASLVGASVAALIGGAAIDLTHPFKEIMASRTVREILWMVGVPAVTASIITLPTAVGLLTPLRYALNESLQPMQPGASDIVRFAVRECFIKERFAVLLEHYPGEEYTKAMAREGYSLIWAQYFWGAHWVLPPITHLNEYLYRHDDFAPMWEKYMRYHDYIPESIPWLREIIYPPWTRVDVRRMWEMRTITESDLYREYRWLGYDDYHAKGMVLWTKIYVAFPDLVARMKNGWITSAQVYEELIVLGMPKERATELMETIVKASSGERTQAERDLTKSEIIKGVKAEILTPEQGVALLMDIGYEEWEAWYILAINKVVTAGHPDGYWEMRKVTEAYKKARGQKYVDIPDELIMLEKAIKEAKSDLARLREEGATEESISVAVVKLGDLEYRMRQLLIAHKIK